MDRQSRTPGVHPGPPGGVGGLGVDDDAADARIGQDRAMSEIDPTAIDAYLEELWKRQASDLLITAGAPPFLRVDGALVRLETAPLDAEDIEALSSAMLGPELAD